MISRKLYINLIVYVLLIVCLSVLLGFIIVTIQSLRYAILCVVAIIILCASLITYLNRTNRNIKFFFDSVKNDDSSLTFPVDDKSAGLKELNESMNRVNKQIQQLKIMNSQQEQYFRKILEHLATAIITYDKKGYIHHANSSAKRLFSMDVLNHLQQIERFDENLYGVIRNLRAYERRLVRINTEQGEIQLSLKSTSFGSDEKELKILSIQDIRHELDEREIDSWMRLIRVLMHEIMNSITPITSLSESLSRIYVSGEKPVTPSEITEKTISTTLQGLNVIKEQGNGLMLFVESYRKLTRIPKPEKKLFRVSGLMARMELLCNPLLDAQKIKIEFRYDDPSMEIFADENLISQVLINLIKNAIEANEENDNARITVTSKTIDNSPEICVIDNGPGISEENLKEIFVPFFTTREKGSGIGLSISKQIMRAHGGNLNVRSVPGKETVFCMRFINFAG